MAIPIILTTYNRLEYFKGCIESLEKSDCDLSALHIFDDCSTDKAKIAYLTEISAKYMVHKRTENVGTMYNTVCAIDFCHAHYTTDIVFLQDDIILSKSWMKRGFEIYHHIIKKNRIPWLCLYNRDNHSEEKYYIMKTGHAGGVAWIINRDWWSHYRKFFKLDDMGLEALKKDGTPAEILKKLKNQHKVRNLVDYKLAHRAHIHGWHLAKVGKSLVQHIGDESSMIHGRDMSEHRSKNFVGVNK